MEKMLIMNNFSVCHNVFKYQIHVLTLLIVDIFYILLRCFHSCLLQICHMWERVNMYGLKKSNEKKTSIIKGIFRRNSRFENTFLKFLEQILLFQFNQVQIYGRVFSSFYHNFSLIIKANPMLWYSKVSS